jgi:hypothetical protein
MLCTVKEGEYSVKKVALIMSILIITLSCVGLVACGGGDGNGNGNGAKPTATATPTTTPTSTSAPSGGLTWDDIPLYSGASQVQKGSWAIPAEQGEWSKVEWRYYETGDSTDDVASFYKSSMPGKGWDEMMWMEAEGIAWAYYTKNNEKDGAMFWCSLDEEENKTLFALMRATQ